MTPQLTLVTHNSHDRDQDQSLTARLENALAELAFWKSEYAKLRAERDGHHDEDR